MNNSDSASDSTGDVITSGQRFWLGAWLVVVLAVAALAGYDACERMLTNRQDSERRHVERMDPKFLESGLTQEELDQKDAKPVPVNIGLYLDRIAELSIKDSSWTADFFLWFRWQGDDIHPGENFQIVDGWVESKEKQDSYVDGDMHYELYRVVAKITKLFDVTRFPLDNHVLVINIECPEYQRGEMIFVPDTELCKASSRARLAGYRNSKCEVVEKPHGYRSTRGDPRLPVDYHAIYSEFRFGVPIERDGAGFFLKLFQGLYASLAIALTAFFIKPTDVDPRFGLGVGAFFASIANSYITSSLIPDSGMLTLADTINGMGMVLIFLTVVQSTISLYMYDICDRVNLSRAFDKISIFGFIVGTVGVNVALPLVARG